MRGDKQAPMRGALSGNGLPRCQISLNAGSLRFRPHANSDTFRRGIFTDRLIRVIILILI